MPGMNDSLSADTQLSSPTNSAAITTPAGPARSTVLPRVEWEGPEPKVSPGQRHRFEELGLLGEGGMGEVLLAQDHDIDREVALKRLPENCDLGRVLRFVEEIRTVGQLEHPNIMPVHDVGVDAAGRYYFVMKRVHGETLEVDHRPAARRRRGDPPALPRRGAAADDAGRDERAGLRAPPGLHPPRSRSPPTSWWGRTAR